MAAKTTTNKKTVTTRGGDVRKNEKMETKGSVWSESYTSLFMGMLLVFVLAAGFWLFLHQRKNVATSNLITLNSASADKNYKHPGPQKSLVKKRITETVRVVDNQTGSRAYVV